MRLSNLVLAVLATTSVSITAGFCDNAKPVDFEKASMKYVLSYAALLKAKQDPSKSAEIPQRLRKYKESYAEYQKLLDENDLYHPTDIKQRNDPAGNYNRKRQKEGKPKRKFKKFDTSKARENVNQTLECGGNLDDTIENVTNTEIPPKGNSTIDLNDFCWNPGDELPEGYDTVEELMNEIETQISDSLNDYSEQLLSQYTDMVQTYKDPTTTTVTDFNTNVDENIAGQAEDENDLSY